MSASKTYAASLAIETNNLSLEEMRAILSDEPGDGSGKVGGQTLWKKHFDATLALEGQLTLAADWLEAHISCKRTRLPVDVKTWLVVGVFSPEELATCTVAISADLLMRLARPWPASLKVSPTSSTSIAEQPCIARRGARRSCAME